LTRARAISGTNCKIPPHASTVKQSVQRGFAFKRNGDVEAWVSKTWVSKTWVLLTSLLSLACAGALQAHPLDSPDIAYIDGVPCNSSCQEYMAWSRQTLAASTAPGHFARRSTGAVVGPATEARAERSKSVAPARTAGQAVPVPREMPRAAIAASQPAAKIAFNSDTTPTKAADLPAAATAAANSDAPTTREEVAAALAAAAVSVPDHKTNSTDAPSDSATVGSSHAENTAPASQNNTDGLVVLVMARPDINSVSGLANKDIALDDKVSASGAGVRAAIVAACAVEAQLSEGHTEAVDRLVGGEAAAAVLALVSPEAAEWFPEIEGFGIFRIPLSAHAEKALH
jgi:hypothetical protein